MTKRVIDQTPYGLRILTRSAAILIFLECLCKEFPDITICDYISKQYIRQLFHIIRSN